MRLFLCTLTLLTCFGHASGDDSTYRGGHRELEVDRAEHDWGIAGQNEQRNTEFTYTNRSERTVTSIRAIGECGCNQISLSHTELAPGASGTMKVRFETVMLSGHLNKFIRLISKDQASGEAKIRQRIAIVQGLILAPSALRFGNVKVDERPKRTFRLKWYEGQGTPFNITSISVPGYTFDTAVVPYQSAKDPNWKGWEVSVGFTHTPPLGMFSTEIVVDTDHPKRPRVTVPLSANICGRVWMQSHTLHFGAFHGGVERKASLRFKAFDFPKVQLGTVTASARNGAVAVSVMIDPIHGDKGYWRLSAVVPADAPCGGLDGEVIVLDPGIPGEAPIEVKVKGYIRKPKHPATSNTGTKGAASGTPKDGPLPKGNDIPSDDGVPSSKGVPSGAPPSGAPPSGNHVPVDPNTPAGNRIPDDENAPPEDPPTGNGTQPGDAGGRSDVPKKGAAK